MNARERLRAICRFERTEDPFPWGRGRMAETGRARAAVAFRSARTRRAQELGQLRGYLPSADHRIPPDVSYRNLVHFLNEVRTSAQPETRREILVPEPAQT